MDSMPVTVKAEKLVFGGDCIAHVNGKAVFIPYAVPGETLDIEIISSKRDYDKAKIVSVRAPSPHRRPPACAYYGLCGGCNMMHIDDAYQRSLRKSVLADCFSRAGIDVPEIDAQRRARRTRRKIDRTGSAMRRRDRRSERVVLENTF